MLPNHDNAAIKVSTLCCFYHIPSVFCLSSPLFVHFFFFFLQKEQIPRVGIMCALGPSIIIQNCWKSAGMIEVSRPLRWLDHSHDLIPAVLITPQGVLQLINTFPQGFKNHSTPTLKRGHEDAKSSPRGADLGLGWCSEKPMRANCRDQTEGNTSCTVAAALHPRSRPPSSLPEDVHVLQSCLRFPLIVPIIHSSPCHPLASLFCPFCQSHPPYFDLILLLRSPCQKKKKKKEENKKHSHACIHPRMRLARPCPYTRQHSLMRGYAKKC